MNITQNQYNGKEYMGPYKKGHITAKKNYPHEHLMSIANLKFVVFNITPMTKILIMSGLSNLDGRIKMNVLHTWFLKKVIGVLCQNRIAYQYQCGHELVVDKIFVLEKWNPGWLNLSTHRKKFPNFACQPPLQYGTLSKKGDEDIFANFEEVDLNVDCNNIDYNEPIINEYTQLNTETADRKDVSYQGLYNMCEQYLKLINRSKNMMSFFYCTLEQLIYPASQNLPSNTKFSTLIHQHKEKTTEPLKVQW